MTSLVEHFEAEFIGIQAYLISKSMVDDQNYIAKRAIPGGYVLGGRYWEAVDPIRPDVPYRETYAYFRDKRAYDLKFLDGALVQMNYTFGSRGRELLRARAAYLPSPDLTPYQSDPELYLHDIPYWEVADLSVTPVPLRFDFDNRDGVPKEMLHPTSHATLGQYPHCRIAVSGPVTPHHFLEFVLRSFYRTAEWICSSELPAPRALVAATITAQESGYGHFAFPCAGR